MRALPDDMTDRGYWWFDGSRHSGLGPRSSLNRQSHVTDTDMDDQCSQGNVCESPAWATPSIFVRRVHQPTRRLAELPDTFQRSASSQHTILNTHPAQGSALQRTRCIHPAS